MVWTCEECDTINPKTEVICDWCRAENPNRTDEGDAPQHLPPRTIPLMLTRATEVGEPKEVDDGAMAQLNGTIDNLEVMKREVRESLVRANTLLTYWTRRRKLAHSIRIPFGGFLTIAHEHHETWTEVNIELEYGHSARNYEHCMGVALGECWYASHLTRVDELQLSRLDTLENDLDGAWTICNTCSIDRCLEMWAYTHRGDPIMDAFVAIDPRDFELEEADFWPLFVQED